MLRSNETERESRILQDFELFEASKRGVNHVFYDGLCASKQ